MENVHTCVYVLIQSDMKLLGKCIIAEQFVIQAVFISCCHGVKARPGV